MEEEKKEKEAAIDQKETDWPVLTVRTGNVLLHIGLHFNEKKEVTADDLFHRLVTERVLKDDFWEEAMLKSVLLKWLSVFAVSGAFEEWVGVKTQKSQHKPEEIRKNSILRIDY